MRMLLITLAALIAVPLTASSALACTAPPGPYLNYNRAAVPDCLSFDSTFEQEQPQMEIVNSCGRSVTVTPVDCALCGGEATLEDGDRTIMVLDEAGQTGSLDVAWELAATDMEDAEQGSTSVSYGEYGSCDGMTNDGCSTTRGNPEAGALLLVGVFFGFARRRRR